MAAANPMLEPRLVKVVVNIGVGEAGDKLIKAEKVMEMVTGAKPARTISRTTNRDWNLREGMPIGVRVTLRGESAEAFLKKAFYVRNGQIPDYSFDDAGNLNFGIADYTEFEGQRYDPEIGIFGMNVSVVLERAGSRVKARRIQPRRIPAHHRVTPQEAISYMKSKFGIEVI
ncbi:MAG TPA: 50S ribosomal protein L5 [Candidatus Thermoplasmatota archaeon]|nr:50S ribosomal protein L5 [Candidatus Thermoplasmatota archaeon]